MLIRLNLELSTDFIVVLITCKDDKGSIKNGGARVFTTLYIDFSYAQGQLTQWDLAEIQTNPSFHACPRYLQE